MSTPFIMNRHKIPEELQMQTAPVEWTEPTELTPMLTDQLN